MIALIAIGPVIASPPAAALTSPPDDSPAAQATDFAVFLFFGACVAIFGDPAKAPEGDLAARNARPIPPVRLRDGDVAGWTLKGAADEVVTLRYEREGYGCSIESTAVDAERLHRTVEDYIRLISHKRAVPYRLDNEKRYEIAAVPVWRRTYLMRERDLPTIGIIVLAALRPTGAMQLQLTYLFVSDPF